MKSNLKAISLFSGAGGLDIGFHREGFEIVLAVESDPSCCKTLKTNMEGTIVVEADVTALNGKDLLKQCSLDVGEVDLVIGGPPCQSFSLAGNRGGLDDDRGKLVLEFFRLVREILPVCFLMENVNGLMNWGGGKAFTQIQEMFEQKILHKRKAISYRVSHAVLDAVDYGVPQYRKRIFFVGNRLGKPFTFPAPTHSNPKQGEFILTQPHVTVGQALAGLPPADEPSAVAKRVSETIKGRREKHGY